MKATVKTTTAASIMRAARRAGKRGVTLIEVMIVVVILGLIAGSVAVAVLPRLTKAQIETTRTSAKSLRTAAETWRGENGGTDCPTAQVLVQSKMVDSASKLTDAWDNPFKITCEEDEIFVFSAGPDKKEGTKDDIRVPETQVQTN